MEKPLIVLADDLTGAAEIAGIALQKGYSVAVYLHPPSELQADVTVMATNTRSLSEQAAHQQITALAQRLKPLYPFYFFKKIDSVLRGHIESEIAAWQTIFPSKQTVILPANPSLGRVIRNGIYWVGEKPIHETSFAIDPEFPWQDSRVLSRFNQTTYQVLAPEQALPEEGHFVLEVRHNEDMAQWAKAFREHTLIVGAAAAFEAMLKALAFTPKHSTPPEVAISTGKKLYVSGTTFRKSVNAIAAMATQNMAVSYLPSMSIDENSDKIVILQNWLTEIEQLLAWSPTVVLAIRPETTGAAQELALFMAEVTQKVLIKYDIAEVLIEGGATAAALINCMQWQYFRPIANFAQGVIRMQCEETPTYLTLKPGSYDWPTVVWEFPNA